MSILLDASALIAALAREPGEARVRQALDGAMISTVNLAEVAGHFARRGGKRSDVEAMLADLPIANVSPDETLAIAAGMLRSATDKLGLSLGDRFCLAQAKAVGARVLTADRAWADVRDALGIDIELIR